jgi:hypothetical protein
MSLFSFTTVHPVFKTTHTIDSGKASAEEALRDIAAYCRRHGYPAPSKWNIVDETKRDERSQQLKREISELAAQVEVALAPFRGAAA